MKSLTKTLTLLSTLILSFSIFSSTAQAGGSPYDLSAKITKIQIDPSLVSMRGVTSGEVVVSNNPASITLNLVDYKKCDPNTICTREMRRPRFIKLTLPIVSSSRSSCGITNYVANVDLTSVYGKIHQIQLVDYRFNTCDGSDGSGASTVITYTEAQKDPYSGVMMQENAYFSAEQLKTKLLMPIAQPSSED